MFAYKMYGASVTSQVPLGNLQSVPSRKPSDFSFRVLHGTLNKEAVNWYHHIRDLAGRPLVSFGKKGSRFVIRHCGGVDFTISGSGRIISAHPSRRISEANLEALFLTQVMPLALSVRGDKVLHASCIEVGDQAIAFIGTEGAGKSTLAAAFVRAGFSILSDDTLPVRIGRNQILAIPSFPEIRGFEKSLSRVLGRKDLQDTRHTFAKRRVNIERSFCRRPRPLTAIYFMAPPKSSLRKIQIRPASVSQGLAGLLRESFRLSFSGPRLIADLRDTSAILERIRLRELNYPRVLGQLPLVVKEILEDVRAKV